MATGDVVVRDVMDDDLPFLFEHQLDPEATEMAAFPSRDRDAFIAHWAKIRADPTVITKTVVVDGEVAGNLSSWEDSGMRLVGYWYGREHWGKGIATKALAEFTRQVATRPLHAYVARHNAGSMRVLEKCGFTVERELVTDGLEELLMRLDA